MMIQQIYIDGTLADVNENTDVTLTLESNMLKGAAEFTGNRSLTITLPSTVHNRTILGHADIVQGGGTIPYEFHRLEYYRNGVQIIKDGLCRLISATPNELQIAVTWGVRTAIDALMTSNATVNDIETDAAIEFHTSPVLTSYNDALTDEVFYAGLDTVHHEDENQYFRMHVIMGSKNWDASNLVPASSYLHPSVRMTWIIDKLEDMFGMTFDFDDAMDDIGTMIVPLISKVPNDITFNGGYKAGTYEPSTWGTFAGNFIEFKTSNPSPIIATRVNPPEGFLECATAFSGMVKFQIYMYMPKADLIPVSAPIYKPKYGYRLDVSVQGDTQSIVFLPEDTIIMGTTDINSGDRVNVYVTGYLPVKMEVGDRLTMRITCIHEGVADVLLPDGPDYNPGIHVQGGPVWVNEIVGSLNEVQPTQQYPVGGNLPTIKPIDLLKFLCAITGTFPVQRSTSDRLILRPVADLFDWTDAVDWTDRVLSSTDRPVPEEKEYRLDGWARNNWWRWKEDETVLGNYDGAVHVDDETIDENRDFLLFPFAATDGNNVPMYTSTRKWDSDAQDWYTEIKWAKVEPRVLRLVDEGGDAMGDFDFDIDNVLSTYYADLESTMEHPVIITEQVRMDDVTFANIDETKAIYIAQHGAFFALLSLELHSHGIAKAKLLKLKKQEEE